MNNDLVRETYEAWMDLCHGRADADETRAKLRSLKERAGDDWNAVKLAAAAADQRAQASDSVNGEW